MKTNCCAKKTFSVGKDVQSRWQLPNHKRNHVESHKSGRHYSRRKKPEASRNNSNNSAGSRSWIGASQYWSSLDLVNMFAINYIYIAIISLNLDKWRLLITGRCFWLSHCQISWTDSMCLLMYSWVACQTNIGATFPYLATPAGPKIMLSLYQPHSMLCTI